MYNNHSIDNKKKKVLKDVKSNGKERPWREKKLKTLDLAEIYDLLGLDNKAFRVKYCSCQLSFKVDNETGEKKLNSMMSCQVRLCPMCNWRRSLKIYSQVSKVMNKALEDKEYRFLFLTLTCENVGGGDLSKTIDNLFHAFKKLSERKTFKQSVKGWFRALEVTHNLDKQSNSYNTYHPHFHIILMVSKSYFTDKDYYISQEKWTSLWKSCMKVEYTPIVHITAFKTGTKKQTAKSIAETAKYTVKDEEYLISKNKELSKETVYILDGALANRRLVAFGGELKKIHKELNLDDAIDGNLVNIDNEDEKLREDIKYHIEVYNWNMGYKQYLKR
ncbi:plasmid rolling circle replication initiator protein Rep [Tissierella praeacuta]|uniref:protein rep n=1 Tax=Tissierella praeacuta TaxID=43131 RepID=UPI00104D3223|nr:protein rep [Tissierella praeacuta]TCU64433.1 plasmid rolling circle replication initiator protein Rep [Tissierella praeacuta]